MNAALLGFLAAAGLGTADFMARFSARALGAALAYAAVLLVGAIGASIWFLAAPAEVVWSPAGLGLAAAHGVSVATMCMLLYAGLARGPVAIVAPIVAAHPALVLAANVAMGVRPSLTQWIAMAGVIVGGVSIARCAGSHPHFAGAGNGEMRTTVLIAAAACVAYAMLLLFAQGAVPRIGELQTFCIGRWTGLAFVILVLIAQRAPVAIPAAWLPFVGLQGALDGLGYVALLAGAKTDAPHVAIVVASTFSVFTVILARLVLKEHIGARQWSAIALIALGTAVLAADV